MSTSSSFITHHSSLIISLIPPVKTFIKVIYNWKALSACPFFCFSSTFEYSLDLVSCKLSFAHIIYVNFDVRQI
jgi:hypothetical protein